MSEAIIPIRAGVTPGLDAEREMVDYLISQIRQFREVAGAPPSRICIALIGRNDESAFTRCNSWDMREETTTLENCATAAMLFTQRALEN